MKLESDPSIVLGLVSAATVSSFSVLGFSEKHFVSPFIDYISCIFLLPKKLHIFKHLLLTVYSTFSTCKALL